MHYLITGHTGFKGSWLSLMLLMQGHTVSGISLKPNGKSLYQEADLGELYEHDFIVDIRNAEALTKAIVQIDPEVIIHLAAQPLVRESYKFPKETFETNVIGTLNVLEATKNLNKLEATLIVTTDKVYKNNNQLRGYTEEDPLGGDDPYSASKAAADIATQSWAKSFARTPVAIARSGNVIGGGDWSSDRIIPDLIDALTNKRTVSLRYPNAIRPWQHVLDCLNGYLKLVDAQIEMGAEGPWNFGPALNNTFTVEQLSNAVTTSWGSSETIWVRGKIDQPHESSVLLLDSTKSRVNLNWTDSIDFNRSVELTVQWYKDLSEKNALSLTRNQIEKFLSD
jgi:CDP-glucose 4,6-dehydratase